MSIVTDTSKTEESQEHDKSKKLKNEISKFYFDKISIHEMTAFMHQGFQQIEDEQNLIETFKSCIREYASYLLQELTPENFKQVQYLWEIHYRIEASSLKTEKLYQLYVQFYQTNPPNSYDFNQMHFDIAKNIKSELTDSRTVHKQYKRQHMKTKPTLVRVLQDSAVPVLQQNNKSKSPPKISQPQQKQKEKPPVVAAPNVRNEFKEFEDRLSKFEINTNKLEPVFSTQWQQKIRNLVSKRKK